MKSAADALHELRWRLTMKAACARASPLPSHPCPVLVPPSSLTNRCSFLPLPGRPPESVHRLNCDSTLELPTHKYVHFTSQSQGSSTGSVLAFSPTPSLAAAIHPHPHLFLPTRCDPLPRALPRPARSIARQAPCATRNGDRDRIPPPEVVQCSGPPEQTWDAGGKRRS